MEEKALEGQTPKKARFDDSARFSGSFWFAGTPFSGA
jgi:hypothetical protein